MVETAVSAPLNLPVGPVGRHGIGWWGAGTLIATEGALFAYLLFSYFYTGATAPAGWLLEPHPGLKLACANTILVLLSSLVAWWGEQGILKGVNSRALLGFGCAFLMGTAFVAIQCWEWRAKTYGIGTSSYASLYFVTSGIHMAHVIVGLAVLLALFSWTALDYFSPRRCLVVSAGVLYWHFVNVVWLFVFTTYDITPYLGFGR